MGCATGCIKVMLIAFNILFWIFGLGLLCIGVWLKVDKQVANLGQAITIGVDDNLVDITSWVFIGAGIFAFIVGFFGCCGAIRESQCLLGFYIVSLILVFAAEIGIAIYVGLQYNQIQDSISKSGKDFVMTQYDGESVVSRGFNYLQMEFCCCGVNNYLDYKDSDFLEDNKQIKEGAYLSYAFCKPSSTQESTNYKNVEPADKDACEAIALGLQNGTVPETTCESAFRAVGCQKALTDWAMMRLPIFFGVGAGVGFIQIFVFCITVCMCVRVRREEKD